VKAEQTIKVDNYSAAVSKPWSCPALNGQIMHERILNGKTMAKS
jgi:hypothetical protein